MPDTPASFEELDEALAEADQGDGLFAGNRRIAQLLGFGSIALLVAVAVATLTMVQVTRETQSVEHTLAVEATTNRMAAFNEQIETGRRGHLIEPGINFRGTVMSAVEAMNGELRNLEALTADNPGQLRRLQEIERLQDERESLLERMFADARVRNQINAGDFNTDRGVTIVRRIRTLAGEMAEAEALLLRERTQSQLDSLIRLYVVGGTALALLIGVLGSAVYLMLRYNQTLTVARQAVELANTGLEAAVTQRTAELQRANAEIQRFAYIVSHDLRSPLVNVLGFTSELDASRKTLQAYITQIFERHPALTNEEVRLAVEEDLPEALGFIRASTEKMDRLINSILELSRQGRRKLSPELLDLNTVAAGVIANLHQRALDSGAEISAEPLPTLVSDRLAVEQILSNLVENAIKYAAKDRPGVIRIAGERSGGMVHIDVIDNGRGIAPEDHERIFELFRRSGQQDQAGEGIGLANVRALAYRLGGTVEVHSELDQGARFRLSLPASFVELEFA
jgi:signal transduction histidine kinase